jgi:hypothetical protein
MNWVDMVFLALLAAALLWGMQRGIGAQLASLVSLVLAAVLAVLFYAVLARLLGPVVRGVSRQGRETVAFLFLLIALTNLINYAARSSTMLPEEQRRTSIPATGLEAILIGGTERFILAPVYMLGSMALAFVLTCMWFSAAAGVLRHALLQPWFAYDGVRAFLYGGLGGSTVVGLLDGAFREAYASLVPLVSEELNNPVVLIHRFNQLTP